ncbi:MAG TPA: MFS transporter [Acidobacteriaceae bacterium]|jgi:predicted MFS family arabinose efflux permease|nr:MFS transporter [Acidobacteriaceae bacterium]
MPPGLAAPPKPRWLSGLWLPYRNLSRGFWTFFAAALFYEAGFGLYFFLFNLYLLDLHFDEKAIGLINSALSLGLLVTTLPVGILSRRFGARPLLLFCFLVAPLLGVLRALWVWEPAQIGLAFTAGLVMSIWTVCFLPVSASFTSESNRTSAIGLLFSVGIGATAVASAASGYLSRRIGMLHPGFGPAETKRVVLLIACAVALLAALPLLRLPAGDPSPRTHTAVRAWDPGLLRNSFLRRYLPCVAIWTSLLAAFTPFAGVYFSAERHIALTAVGLIFGVSQIAQLIAGFLIPVLVRRCGLLDATFVTQLGTALLLVGLVLAGAPAWAAAAFVLYSAAQWMSSTAIYTLLMSAMAEADRSSASAMTMFCNSLGTACATSAAGALLVRFHYAPVLAGIAVLQAALAILFRRLMQDRRRSLALAPALPAGGITD